MQMQNERGGGGNLILQPIQSGKVLIYRYVTAKLVKY